jgi:hypothetical protein
MRNETNVKDGTNLGREVEAIAMAHQRLFGVARHSKVGNVRSGLSAAHDHDSLILAELSARLEL